MTTARRRRADLELEARVAAGPDRFRFRTADGLCSPEDFRTAELLLAETLWERAPAHPLVLEANYGVVGCLAVPVAAAVTMTESSARAAGLCRENARHNGVDATVELLAELDRLPAAESAPVRPRIDTAAYAPKPYTPLAVARQRIADALALLEPGDAFLLAAAPATGLERYRDTLESIGAEIACAAEHGGTEVLVADRPATVDPPEFVEPRVLEPTVDGTDLQLVSVPGTFAAGGLDHGTRLLLETIEVPDDARVLDVCCGYGPIGTYAAATADAEVWLSDDDRVATRCAECSVERTDLAAGSEATVVTGDCTEAVADRRFDLVLANPPTHAGAGVLSELFAGIRDVLAPGGECLFVRHEALDLTDHCRAFGPMETVATGREHVVRRAVP